MDPYSSLALIHQHKQSAQDDVSLLSPTVPSHQGPASHHSPGEQVQAASMRRKKNADAQAAFRARRANYISSLEETVTSLEAVVLSLQDTCRETRNDADDLRRENTRLTSMMDSLKVAARDRERQWREFWQTKQQTLGLDDSVLSDMPPLGGVLHSFIMGSRPAYVDETYRYQNGCSEQYPLPPARELEPRYTGQFTASPDGTWLAGPFSNTRTPIADVHPSSSSSSDSPQTLSPNVQYISRFPVPGSEDTRMTLVSVNMANGSYDTNSLVQDYSDGYNNTRQFSDAERYAPRPRRAYSGPTHRSGDIYGADISQTDNEGFNGDAGVHDHRSRRHTVSHTPSHSPSSSPPPHDRDSRENSDPPMSNTLAMIKAQAFGSLRRSRAKPKKGAEAASKVAVDILNARGIGMGVQQPGDTRLPMKRKSSDLDDLDIHS
ncbi:hypothetical protein M422DRAFT_38503 [Sphaerobolus stellatus SS14]|uniref:BZIP domain-containing protein n=1 Tax=Sphaerobolus stellatus (strain SS14) TaxID=990650 RepID=A0A0C9TV78_SPHS4|nr:hypothetical protein M422DRAFT_38503 [Sphaerobolus stellatus SS14]